MKRTGNVAAAIAAAVMLAGGFQSFAATNETETLKVGSYNIRCPSDKGDNAWERRRSDLVSLVRTLDFDVFGLQEVAPRQAKYLRKALPQYKMVGEFRNADRKSGEASPVCYRKDRFEAIDKGTFWLSETPDVPGSRSWKTSCPRVCSWLLLKDKKNGKTFCFANAHTDHRSALARLEGMKLVIKRMRDFAPPGTPIIFTGDHNCLENSKPAKAVAEILKDSIYVTETAPKGPWRTYTGWTWLDNEYSAADALKLQQSERNKPLSSSKTGYRIDYIYVSKGIRVTAYAVHADPRPGVKLYPSDHFPVSASVILP